MNDLINILNIEVQHEYYADGKCKNLQLTPDTDTQQWLQQYGWRITQRENKWHFFAPASTNVAQLVQDHPDFKLTFEGSPSDSSFISFTGGLPLNEWGILVFSNSSDSSTILSSEFEASSDGNPAAIARIQLHLDQLEDNTNREPIEYTISFKARALVWKFFIINGTDENPYALHLKGDQADLFSGPTEESLPNGNVAQVFDSSPNLLPLKEESKLNLGLWGKHLSNTPPNEISLINRLPNANPSSLQAATVDEEQIFFAPLYIYL